jgi:1,4-alpha-glucan branching enzyme
MKHAYWGLVLHAHLPYIRHYANNNFLEEDWYYEALFEVYLPLLDLFNRLQKEKVSFQITISISPTLLTMMQDDLLQERALQYADQRIKFLQDEKKRLQSKKEFYPILKMYDDKFKKYRDMLDVELNKNLIREFKKFSDAGMIEILTTVGTHALLPYLPLNAIHSQIQAGIQVYQDCFGKAPRGLWLPECGICTGLDAILKEHKIQFVLVDTHALLLARPFPSLGTLAPIYTPAHLWVFGRDFETSKEVWSSKEGYPGDAEYREFYRDVGFDLMRQELEQLILKSQPRKFTGIKYYRITNQAEDKKLYQPELAQEKARIHAQDFFEKRKKQIEGLKLKQSPYILSMYDAELFGHWWYEGIYFLEFLFKILDHQKKIKLMTPTGYLKKIKPTVESDVCFSTWGENGYGEYWLNEKNDWVYPINFRLCYRLKQLAKIHFNTRKQWIIQTLNQAVREILLFQSSDWTFMIKNNNYGSYARKRLENHMKNCLMLLKQVEKNIPGSKLAKSLWCENPIFPKIDFRVFSKN